MTAGLLVGATITARTTRARRTCTLSLWKGFGARLNRSPKAAVGDMVMATEEGQARAAQKGAPSHRRAPAQALEARERHVFVLEDNAGVIVNSKGEMKDHRARREEADLWPKIASAAGSII